MGEIAAKQWAEIGRANLRDAQELFAREAWRSCVSRAYYSAMASSHAILIHLNRTPPELGNWPNPRLAAALSAALGGGNSKDHRVRVIALTHRSEIATCWSYRLQADYSPTARMTDSIARRAVECARNLSARWEAMR
jgi:hypothetical protein